MSSQQKSVILATAGYDHNIRFWEATGHPHMDRTLEYNQAQVNALAITPDKYYLAVAGHPHVKLYRIDQGQNQQPTSFDGHASNVTAVGFQRDRKWMYTGSEDGTIKIWDIRTPGFQCNYLNKGRNGSCAAVNSVALHPNQGELISADEKGVIRVWDLTANKCSFKTSPDGKTPLRSVCTAADASVACAVNNRGSMFVWRLDDTSAKMKLVHTKKAHNTYALKCLLSPDVSLLATTSSDKTVRIWDAANGYKLMKTLTGHTGWVWDCAFSADSAYLISGSSDKTAKLWDVAGGTSLLEYTGHLKAVTAVALNDISV